MSQLLRFATVPNFIYFLFLVWIFVSIKLIRKAIRGADVNEYFYSSIPNVFTTIGILGTFIGIYIGLQGFDTSEISSSIPVLLNGLKTAFLTSILGIVLSLIFGRISELALGFAYSSKKHVTNELQALQAINDSLVNLRSDFLDSKKIAEEQRIDLKNIGLALGDDSENSLLFQLKKNQIDSNDNFKSLSKSIDDSNKELRTIGNALVNEEENSLLSQVKQIRVDSNMNFESLTHYLDGNKKDLHEKFQEFAQLLADNNTEALVEVMKSATEEFNGQMSSLINKLVQENFSELNTSVKKLNDWQVQNKEMVSELTKKHKETVDQFEISAKAIQNVSSTSELIVSHVKELVNEKSKLQQLVEALNKVLVEDERFENSTKNLLNAIGKVEKNIDAFDKTTHKLNDWIEREHSIKESTNALLIKLDEVSNIKSYNGQFWDETKKQLNEGTQLITNNTEKLSSSLDGINQEFQNQLGEILGSLDELIQRLIIKAKDN